MKERRKEGRKREERKERRNEKNEGEGENGEREGGRKEVRKKRNKPGGERQMPYDLIYKWNLINKTNMEAKYNQRH